MDVYSIMEHSLVSTPLSLERLTGSFLCSLCSAVSQSERQCHLVDAVSEIVVDPKHTCIS